MGALDSVAQFFQSTLGSISISTMDHRWIIIGIAVLVVGLIVFTQDKTKAISILISVYAVCFVALMIPAVVAAIEKNIPEKDLFILTIIQGSLPIVGLLVLKYKKGKKRPGLPT